MTDPRKVYIFFGHGWNTDQTVDISQYTNLKIAMMKHACLLFEDREIKHLKNIMKIGMKGYTQNDYVRDLFQHATEKYRNEFCVYDSEELTIVPNLLLTVYSKDDELVRLQRIGDIRPTKFPENVMLLSELVESLGGNDITLIIYTCRGQFDSFQLTNLQVFGPNQSRDIANKVYSSNIKVLPVDSEEEIYNPPCRDLDTGSLI